MRCAVLGDPVAHSLSPVLHRAAYAELGLTQWSYEAVRVAAGGLAAYVGGLDPTWRGLSVTAPLKREALALAAATGTLSATARLAGGVNTLVLGEHGVHGDNTDLPGAASALRERHAGAVDRVTVLGAGATAASVALALCGLGAGEVTLLARDPARAEATRAAVAAHPARPEVRLASLDAAPGTGPEADVLVSTVPAAVQDPGLVGRCARVPVVFEVVYDPWPTPLAAAVQASGRTLVSGLDLLVHQAALQLTAFTGHAAPLPLMRRAGLDALAERG